MNKSSNDPIIEFENEKKKYINSYKNDKEFQSLSHAWLLKAFQQHYMYNFSSLGRPIIQTPIDMIVTQEIIWSVKPDLIIETGIAHGGSLIMSASMLALLDYCDAVESNEVLDPKASKKQVLGIDIDVREHNRTAIEKHPMSHRINMIEGSSIDPNIIKNVVDIASKFKKVLVFLDSNHTHEHVLEELNAYAPLVSLGSYCVVFDTIVEDLPDDLFPNRPWCKGNNPKTAINEYLKTNNTFIIDNEIEDKLLITVAPNGFLKRIS